MVVVARETRPAPEEAAPDVLVDCEEGREPCSQIFGAQSEQKLAAEEGKLPLEHGLATPDRRVRRPRRIVRRPLLLVGGNQRIGDLWRRGEHPTELVARRGVHERRRRAEGDDPLICVRWGPVRKLDSCCQGDSTVDFHTTGDPPMGM